MSIKQELVSLLSEVCKDLGLEVSPSVDPDWIGVEYPTDPKHGDYSSNVALVAFRKNHEYKSPLELAQKIADKFSTLNSQFSTQVAPPGFINFWVKDDALLKVIPDLIRNPEEILDSRLRGNNKKFSGKKIMVEFAHPNTHKAFHIGHLRNITTGESIVRLLEATGTEVIRANYQGDVGMHIAKALFGLLQISNLKSQISNLKDVKERIDFLGKAYIEGSKAFEEDEKAKKEILEINKKIYARDPSVWELYQTTRQWSLDYFEAIYKRVGSHFDRYYFESEVYESGKQIVLDGIKKGVFEESNGAIIFPGSKFGLHDRVFITSEGNPTYEGKDIGLAPLQFKEYDPAQIIHVVGPEQAGYFQVVFEALSQLFPETKGKEYHLAYGWVKLKHGKMSSRTGNVVLGELLLDSAKQNILEQHSGIAQDVAEDVGVGAVKYSFLKVSTAQEIAFDLEESISFDGNSGPYIQYTYARTRSVLRKSQISNLKSQILEESFKLQPEERDLLRLLARFPEIVAEAAERLAPNLLCTYLFELAQTFNLFYQKHQILKSEEEMKKFRLFLTEETGNILKKGLSLLGIKAPEKM